MHQDAWDWTNLRRCSRRQSRSPSLWVCWSRAMCRSWTQPPREPPRSFWSCECIQSRCSWEYCGPGGEEDHRQYIKGDKQKQNEAKHLLNRLWCFCRRGHHPDTLGWAAPETTPRRWAEVHLSHEICPPRGEKSFSPHWTPPARNTTTLAIIDSINSRMKRRQMVYFYYLKHFYMFVRKVTTMFLTILTLYLLVCIRS